MCCGHKDQPIVKVPSPVLLRVHIMGNLSLLLEYPPPSYLDFCLAVATRLSTVLACHPEPALPLSLNWQGKKLKQKGSIPECESKMNS